MPTFFVIGAAKCGTTSLHEYLDLHPDISMSSIKEPRYFCRDISGYHLDVISDRDEYVALFKPGTTHRGEASPQYSSRGYASRIAEAIHREVPDALLVYLVRDPVERVASQYAQALASRDRVNRELTAGRTDFGAPGLAKDIGDIESPSNPYTSQGLYMTQISAFMDFFPRESLLVVDSDELKDERKETLAAIFRFLDLEPIWDPDRMSRERNLGDEQIRDPDAYLALAQSKFLRRLVDILPRPFRTSMVAKARRIVGKEVRKPDLESELRRQLEELYRPEVEKLREFTGMDFKSWSI